MNENSMDINAPEGTKVKPLFDSDGKIMNGYDHDIEHAMKHLKQGETYTVDRTEIHSWHTKVYLQEIPGVPFNSVHFTQLDINN